ncbi:MAG: winged helix-turn-helix transcriptional regulator [Paramuribaculum sp.]|nr:winged helix-turn-helix transcriptional regulator [Paramuribaculum sp.]
MGFQDVKTDSPKSQIDTLDCTFEKLTVIKVIEANSKIAQPEIAKSTKKSASTVKRITSTLVKKGILIRRNGRRNGWWEIIKTMHES